MPLFEVAIIKKDGKNEELLLSPYAILAKNQEAAKNKALLSIMGDVARDFSACLDKIEILCRPFA